MIRFKDFVPAQLKEKKAGFFSSSEAEMEVMESTMFRMNQWLEENPDLEVVNVETVVLPNIHSRYEEGSEDTELRSSGEISAYWYQIIRVWYKE